MSDTMQKIRVATRALKAWSEWHKVGAVVKLPIEIARSLIASGEAEEVPAKGAKKKGE